MPRRQTRRRMVPTAADLRGMSVKPFREAPAMALVIRRGRKPRHLIGSRAGRDRQPGRGGRR